VRREKKHWHDATRTHIAIQERDANGKVVGRIEKHSDERYLGD
jgi:hypothetical protein